MFLHQYGEMEKLYPKDVIFLDDDSKKVIEEIISRGGRSCEVRTKHKYLSTFTAEISSSLFRDNHKVFILFICNDITERKNHEWKRKENVKKYRGIFDNSDNGMVLLEERGVIIDANKKMERLTDLKKHELLHRNILHLEIFSQETISIVFDHFKYLLNDTSTIVKENKMTHRDGRVFDIDLSFLFLYKTNDEFHYFIICICYLQQSLQSHKIIDHIANILQLILDHFEEVIYCKNI